MKTVEYIVSRRTFVPAEGFLEFRFKVTCDETEEVTKDYKS